MSFILKETIQNLIKNHKKWVKRDCCNELYYHKTYMQKKTLTRKKLWREAWLPIFRGAGSRELFIEVSKCFRIILADELDLLTTKTKVFSLRRI